MANQDLYALIGKMCHKTSLKPVLIKVLHYSVLSSAHLTQMNHKTSADIVHICLKRDHCASVCMRRRVVDLL